MIERVHRLIELTHPTTGPSLAFFRVLLASYLLLFQLPIGTTLPDLPASLFHPPPGLPHAFGGFPSAAAVIVGNVVACSLAFMLMIGYRARASAIGLSLSLLLLSAWQFSVGKIDHNLLAVMAPLVFAWSGWDKTWVAGPPPRAANAAVDDGRSGNRCAFLFAMIVGLTMSTAGLAKLYGNWLDTTTSATLGHAISVNWFEQRTALLFEPARRTMSPWMWEAMDWAAVIFELAAGVAFLRRSWWRWWLVVAVFFHAGVWLKFAIVFAPSLVSYAAFVRWESVFPGLRRAPAAGDASPTPTWLWAWAIGVAIVATAHAVVTQTSLWRTFPQDVHGVIFCVPACLIAGVWAARQLIGLLPFGSRTPAAA